MLPTSNSAALRDDRDRFVAFAFASAELLLELDGEGVIRFAAGAVKELTGKSLDEISGSRIEELVSSEDRPLFGELMKNIRPGMRMEPTYVHLDRSRSMAILGGCRLPDNGERFYLTLSRTSLPFGHLDDLTKDPVSGLLDMDEFAKLAQQQLDLAVETGRNNRLTLLRLQGLDSGADLNEGQEQVLHDIGSYLRGKSLGGIAAARLGKDKFALLHTGNVGEGGIVAGLKDIIGHAEGHPALEVDGHCINMQADGLDDSHAAQALLYTINRFASSKGGEFKISSLKDGLKEEMTGTLARISNIKRIVDEGNFDLVFQPIVDLQTRHIHHYEALTRFRMDESPFETIAFAEDMGLIVEFDLAVCRKAIDVLLAYRGKHGEKTILPQIAVNVSGRSLETDAYVHEVRSLFNDYPSLRRHILFEITESTRIENLHMAERVTRRLRADGHRVCLDDFGAGATSFQYLSSFAVDYVKMDGAYVRKVMSNVRDASILRAMASLCRDLNIGLVAEMIETEEQVKKLRKMDVGFGQGWVFGKPGPRIPGPGFYSS